MHGSYRMTNKKLVFLVVAVLLSMTLFIFNKGSNHLVEVYIKESKLRYSVLTTDKDIQVSESNNIVSIPTENAKDLPVEVMKLTLLSGVQKDAVCLDGSIPGIYTRAGHGKGMKNWIIHLQGGYRCISEEDCMARSVNEPSMSSSKELPGVLPFEKSEGILSPYKGSNPHFFNWNVAYIPYCDGSAFLGNRDEPLIQANSGTIAYLRGRRIARETLGFLRTKGLENAEHVLLTGCGSSSLGALLNSEILESFPKSIKVHLLLDGGFLYNAGASITFRAIFKKMFEMNYINEFGLVNDCFATPNLTRREDCFYMNLLLQRSSQDIMVMTSLYDPWQLVYLQYVACHSNNCLPQLLAGKNIDGMQALRRNTQHVVKKLKKKKNLQFYQTSCLQKCVSLSDQMWNKILVNGTTPSDAVYKWIEHKASFREYTDCAYPQCNAHCPAL